MLNRVTQTNINSETISRASQKSKIATKLGKLKWILKQKKGGSEKNDSNYCSDQN